MTQRLAGKRALVTGAGRGIGRGIALEFARQGAAIALHYSHAEDPFASAVDEIERAGGRVKAIQADFNRSGDLAELAREALGFLGGLDILVNNAGVTLVCPFEKVTIEQFESLYNINVRAPFFLTQHCLPALIAGAGAVINISSIHAVQGNPGHAVYAGTKGALSAFSRELAIELALKGVRVNAIAPGMIAVEKSLADPKYNPESTGRKIPAGFVGQPIDVANLAVFLASSEARYIVGQTLVIDGGTTAWMPFSEAFRGGDAR